MSVPDHVIASVDRFCSVGKSSLKRGDYDHVIYNVGFAALKFPKESKLHSILGVAYFNIGELKKARTCANTAIELDPGNGYAHLLDIKLIASGCNWEDTAEIVKGDDDMNSEPESEAGVPKHPKNPNPTSDIALDPYEISVPIP